MQKREIEDWNKRQAENEKKIEEAVVKMLARPGRYLLYDIAFSYPIICNTNCVQP